MLRAGSAKDACRRLGGTSACWIEPDVLADDAVRDDGPAVVQPIERAERGPIEQLGGELHGHAGAAVGVHAAQGREVAPHLLVAVIGVAEIVAGDGQHPQLAVGDHVRHPRLAFDQAELAEGLAGLQPRHLHDAAVGLGAEHPHAAGQDDVEVAAELALPADKCAVRENLLVQAGRTGGQTAQQGHLLRHLFADLPGPELAQALCQHAIALDQLAEAVARHAQQPAIRDRPHAGGATGAVAGEERLLGDEPVDLRNALERQAAAEVVVRVDQKLAAQQEIGVIGRIPLPHDDGAGNDGFDAAGGGNARKLGVGRLAEQGARPQRSRCFMAGSCGSVDRILLDDHETPHPASTAVSPHRDSRTGRGQGRVNERGIFPPEPW
jgi:hypothetical protein